MRSANNAPTTARNTPSPTLALGVAETPVPGCSPAAPTSSQGFAVSLWVDSHHTANTDSAEKNRMVTPTPRSSVGVGRARLVLRDEVLLGARHVVVVGPAVDDRQLLAEIAVAGRRLGRLPFERRGAPGIAAGLPA